MCSGPIDSLVDPDSRIGTKAGVELSPSHIESNHFRRTMLEQTVCKTARARPHIETAQISRIKLKVLERPR